MLGSSPTLEDCATQGLAWVCQPEGEGQDEQLELPRALWVPGAGAFRCLPPFCRRQDGSILDPWERAQ